MKQKLMVLVAMLAMMLVMAAPAMADEHYLDYYYDNGYDVYAYEVDYEDGDLEGLEVLFYLGGVLYEAEYDWDYDDEGDRYFDEFEVEPA